MTLDTSLSRAQFEGNGAATEFPFNFKVWDVSEIAVSVGLPNGFSETVVPDAVTLTDSGGTVTYTRDGAPLPAGYTLGIVRSMPFVQPDDYISGTRFDAEVIERSLDVACAERQQLREALSRAVIVDPSSDTDPLDMVHELFEARDETVSSAGNAAASEANAANSASEAAGSAAAAAESAESAAESAEQSEAILQDNQAIEDSIENMILNMANASISKKVFLYGAGEREDVVAAGTPFTVPTYQVGVGALSVFIDSTIAMKDRDYEEIGDSLSMSTQIKLTSDLQPYHELAGEVLSAVINPDDPSAVQRIIALEDRMDTMIPLPVGVVLAYAGTDEPLGWRKMNGQTLVGVSALFPDFKTWAVDDGYAPLCTMEEYAAELTAKDGQCGKFGWDEATDTLRLPTITGFIGAAASGDAVGEAVLAGLPNITGSQNGVSTEDALTGAFDGNLYQEASNIGTGSNIYYPLSYIDFDASRSSAVYGRSATVTPAHVKYPYIIKVADAVYPPSVMDARKMSNLVSSLREDMPGMAAHAASPSDLYIDFSGNEYTAPADGFVHAIDQHNNTDEVYRTIQIQIQNREGNNFVLTQLAGTSVKAAYVGVSLPIGKGQKAVITSNMGTAYRRRFTYSNGNAPSA